MAERQIFTQITNSAAATEQLGAKLSKELTGGNIILLEGDLGAGKSTFIRGALRALGVSGPMPSPSYLIGIAYQGDCFQLSHLDLYRLESSPFEEPGLLEAYFGADTISFIEWPIFGAEVLKPYVIDWRVKLAGLDLKRRQIEVIKCH